MIHKVEHESKINCPADSFSVSLSKTFLTSQTPCLEPSRIDVKVLKGDGKSLGSILLWTYILGDDPNKVLNVKELVEEFDDENRRITFRFLEGERMVDYESFAMKLSVTPTSDGGSLVKLVTKFEKKHDQSPHPHSHVDVLAKISGHFDALIQKLAAAE